MSGTHRYAIAVEWTGNTGAGTASYKSYARDHEIRALGKPAVAASSDPSFRGDPARYNPEELLVASLSSCHMLWFLHLCARDRIVVTAYLDDAAGTMVEDATGGGHFTAVMLRPDITVKGPVDAVTLDALQHEAHEKCFIAASVNFPVRCEATYHSATTD